MWDTSLGLCFEKDTPSLERCPVLSIIHVSQDNPPSRYNGVYGLLEKQEVAQPAPAHSEDYSMVHGVGWNGARTVRSICSNFLSPGNTFTSETETKATGFKCYPNRAVFAAFFTVYAPLNASPAPMFTQCRGALQEEGCLYVI